MKLLFLSHSADLGFFKVGSHHLSHHLRLLGHQTAHVSTPVTPLHVARWGQTSTRARMREAAKTLLGRSDLNNLVPLGLTPLGSSAIPFMTEMPSGLTSVQRQLAKFASSSGQTILLVDQPRFAPWLRRLSYDKLVYRPTDQHFGDAARAERVVVERATAAVATSEVVLSSVGMPASRPTMVLENGVEWSRFACVKPRGERNGLIYVGAIDHRFDFKSVEALARALPTERITLVGPYPTASDEFLSLSSLPNVQAVGPLPYADIANIMVEHRVGLLPFRSEAVENAGRSPMKFYEYLAAGLSVLGQETPTLATRGAPNTFLYSGRASIRDVAVAALERPKNDAGQEFSRSYDWPERATRLEQFVASLS